MVIKSQDWIDSVGYSLKSYICGKLQEVGIYGTPGN